MHKLYIKLLSCAKHYSDGVSDHTDRNPFGHLPQNTQWEIGVHGCNMDIKESQRKGGEIKDRQCQKKCVIHS
jgi:hypothetical protein